MPITELCTVLRSECIAPNLYLLDMKAAEISKTAYAGQFLHIKCGEGNLLRRPISICDKTADGEMRIVFEAKGEGTRWLSARKAGDALDVLGPLGRGFNLAKAGEHPVFIGGGIGVPPMLLAAKEAAAMGAHSEIIAGFRTKNAVILEEECRTIGDSYIATDDGSYGTHGFVTDVLKSNLKEKKYTAVYCCGPRGMLRALAETAKANGIYCQVSMEERMGCGVGACLVCACKVKSQDKDFDLKHVCKDGPVFDAEEVIL